MNFQAGPIISWPRAGFQGKKDATVDSRECDDFAPKKERKMRSTFDGNSSDCAARPLRQQVTAIKGISMRPIRRSKTLLEERLETPQSNR